VGPGREGETPREGKAHEGLGFRIGLNHRTGVRTLAGSKALKWGLLPWGRVKYSAVLMKDHCLGGLEGQRGWRGDRELG
jgi:hypothetical protein